MVTLSFSFLYFDYFSPNFILYKFDIIFLIQSIFFPHKIVSTLSLSGLLFFLIPLIKVDGAFFFFNICFSIVCVCVCVFFFFFSLESLLFPFHSFG